MRNITSSESSIHPSKAAILNKVRWALHERKVAKRVEDRDHQLRHESKKVKDTKSKLLPIHKLIDLTNLSHEHITSDQINMHARSLFPYYNNNSQRVNPISTRTDSIFFENAGGAQGKHD